MKCEHGCGRIMDGVLLAVLGGDVEGADVLIGDLRPGCVRWYLRDLAFLWAETLAATDCDPARLRSSMQEFALGRAGEQ